MPERAALASHRLRPLRDDDLPALREILRTPEVARWWPPDGAEPDETLTRFAVEVEGELAGMVQFWEEPDPNAKHADVDVFLAPAFHGRGIGTDVMNAVVDHLVRERGHHRVTLGTDVDNAGAQRCYEKADFRRVGVLRASARHHATGEWRDEVLMERVVSPPPSR